MSTNPVNQTEQFVLDICRRSFLSLWCYNNPRGKNGDELCDILAVCGLHLIIISVKEVQLKGEELTQVQFERWERKAVDASIDQIYGAQRWLASATQVIRGDGSPGLMLPPVADRKVHRIAVAYGSRGEMIIKSGDFGKGFVHVLTGECFQQVLGELDTITDLVDYLAAKEACIERGCSIILQGSESNLLGWYLHNGRTFPGQPNVLVVNDDVWAGLQGGPEFQRRKEADRVSYAWDTLIEHLSGVGLTPGAEAGPETTDFEIALRAMARENRFTRRLLGRGLSEFIELGKAGKVRSRFTVAPSGVVYLFVFFRAGEDGKYRVAELGNRCYLARHEVGRGDTVIGIGISEHVPNVGCASDLCYFNLSDWSAADDEQAARMRTDLGYLKGAKVQHFHEDEYPTSP